jgi:hypothetical protein
MGKAFALGLLNIYLPYKIPFLYTEIPFNEQSACILASLFYSPLWRLNVISEVTSRLNSTTAITNQLNKAEFSRS